MNPTHVKIPEATSERRPTQTCTQPHACSHTVKFWDTILDESQMVPVGTVKSLLGHVPLSDSERRCSSCLCVEHSSDWCDGSVGSLHETWGSLGPATLNPPSRKIGSVACPCCSSSPASAAMAGWCVLSSASASRRASSDAGSEGAAGAHHEGGVVVPHVWVGRRTGGAGCRVALATFNNNKGRRGCSHMGPNTAVSYDARA